MVAPPRFFYPLLLALSWALTNVTAGAATIEVAPVLVEFTGAQRAASLTIVNREAHPVTLQLRGFTWQQDRTGDILTPSDDLQMSPPIFTLPAGESQLVRIFARGKPVPEQEQAYRLLIDEIPTPSSDTAVRLTVRISLPVFQYPGNANTPKLQWQVQVEPGGEAWLTAANTGNRRLKFARLEVALPGAGAPREVPVAQPAYLLAGAKRRWRLEGTSGKLPPGSTLGITGLSDMGALNAQASASAAQ